MVVGLILQRRTTTVTCRRLLTHRGAGAQAQRGRLPSDHNGGLRPVQRLWLPATMGHELGPASLTSRSPPSPLPPSAPEQPGTLSVVRARLRCVAGLQPYDLRECRRNEAVGSAGRGFAHSLLHARGGESGGGRLQELVNEKLPASELSGSREFTEAPPSSSNFLRAARRLPVSRCCRGETALPCRARRLARGSCAGSRPPPCNLRSPQTSHLPQGAMGLSFSQADNACGFAERSRRSSATPRITQAPSNTKSPMSW